MCDLISNYLSNYPLLSAAKGHNFFFPKDNIDHFIYIKSGYIKVLWRCCTGPEILVHILKPECTLPIMCFLNKVENKFLFKALTKVEYYQLNQKQLDNIFQDNPQLFKEYTFKLCNALRWISIRLIESYSGSAFDRLLSTLVYINKTFSKEESIKLSHREIASLCGLTRETTTKELNKLEKMGVLKLGYGKIENIDNRQLNDLITKNALLNKLIN
jgi:CRP-like cAMP-binding protein